MPTYPFMQVDAFTSRPLHGNPCAVLLDTDDLDDSDHAGNRSRNEPV